MNFYSTDETPHFSSPWGFDRTLSSVILFPVTYFEIANIKNKYGIVILRSVIGLVKYRVVPVSLILLRNRKKWPDSKLYTRLRKLQQAKEQYKRKSLSAKTTHGKEVFWTRFKKAVDQEKKTRKVLDERERIATGLPKRG